MIPVTLLLGSLLAQNPSLGVAPLGATDWIAPPEVSSLLEVNLRSPQVTNKTPSPTNYTAPSLWLTNKLYGNKLILEWLVFRRLQDNKSQVRLIVRPDLWQRYTYLERYSFLRNFGEATSAVGYQLLVLDRQSFPLAAHICDFPSTSRPISLYPFAQRQDPSRLPTKPNVPCQLWLNPIYGSTTF